MRTFLEVSRTRHFGQAAVSARIKSLEEMLGVKLFIRDRRDIKLINDLLDHFELD